MNATLDCPATKTQIAKFVSKGELRTIHPRELNLVGTPEIDGQIHWVYNYTVKGTVKHAIVYSKKLLGLIPSYEIEKRISL